MSVPEHDAGLVAALHPLDREDPLDDCCLPNVADVDSRPEARHDLRGVEQHAHTRLQSLLQYWHVILAEAVADLEILARYWLVALGADGNHAAPQLGQRDVQRQGRALLRPHQPARSFVTPDARHLSKYFL